MKLFETLENHVQEFLNEKGIHLLEMEDDLHELLQLNGGYVFYNEEKGSFRICDCGVYIEEAHSNLYCPVCTTKAKMKKLSLKEFDKKQFYYKDFLTLELENNILVLKKGKPLLSLIVEDDSYKLKLVEVKGIEERYEILPNGEHLKSKELLTLLTNLNSTQYTTAINLINKVVADEYKMPLVKGQVREKKTQLISLVYYSVKELRILCQTYGEKINFVSLMVKSKDGHKFDYTPMYIVNNIIADNFCLDTEEYTDLSNGNDITTILNCNKELVDVIGLLSTKNIESSLFIKRNESGKYDEEKISIKKRLNDFLDIVKDINLLKRYMLINHSESSYVLAKYILNINYLFENGYKPIELIDYLESTSTEEKISFHEIIENLIELIENQKVIIANTSNVDSISKYPKNIEINKKLKDKEKNDMFDKNIENYLDVIYEDMNKSYFFEDDNYEIVKPKLKELKGKYKSFYEETNYLRVQNKKIMNDKLQNNEGLYYLLKDKNNHDLTIILYIDLEEDTVKIAYMKGLYAKISLTDKESNFVRKFCHKFKLSFID